MKAQDILEICELAEQGKAQFKERVTKEDQYDIACEMVAMSNYKGGKLLIGIVDKSGKMNPLSHHREFVIIIKRNVVETVDESSEVSSEPSSEAGAEIKNYKKLTGKQLERMGFSPKEIMVIMYCSVPRKAEEIISKAGVKDYAK